MYHLAFHHWSKFQTKLTTFRGVIPPKKGGTYTSPLPPPFPEIVLCQGYFPENSLLCHSANYSKHFGPGQSQNLVGDPEVLPKIHPDVA